MLLPEFSKATVLEPGEPGWPIPSMFLESKQSSLIFGDNL